MADGSARRWDRTRRFTFTTHTGESAAEYSTVAPNLSGPLYLTSDHLGSTRVATVDQQKFPVDKTREQAIQHFLDPKKVAAPVIAAPGGQQ